MSNRLEPGYVLPNQKIPKILGMLNITFGVGLLLVALAFVGFVWLFPSVLDVGTGPQATITSNAVKIGMNPRQATPIAWRHVVFWIEVSLAIVLNLAMIVSGFGLIQLKNRARKLAIWVAGLKLVRLLGMAFITIFFYIPEEMRANETGPSPPIVVNTPTSGSRSQTTLNVQSAAGLTAVMETTAAAGELLIGSIYPVLVLILLTRISVWAACIAAERQRGAGPKPVMPKPKTMPEC
jgi:hypothetical protein